MWGYFLLWFSLTLSGGVQGGGGRYLVGYSVDGPMISRLGWRVEGGGLVNFSDGGPRFF